VIVRGNKGYETRSDKPNEDWYSEGNYVVNETTKEGKALAKKIVNYYPRYDFVKDESGNITGFIFYEKVILSCPSTALSGRAVAISVTTENNGEETGDGVEAALYIDGAEQARGPMPITWPVIFDTPGTYLIEVDAGRHGRVSREVMVE